MLFWSVLFVIIAVVLHIWGTLTLRSTQKRTEEKNIIFSYISICISVLMVVYTILFNAGILIDPDSFLTSFFSSVDTSKIPLEAVTFRGHSYYLYDPGESIWDEVLRNCSSKQGYRYAILYLRVRW